MYNPFMNYLTQTGKLKNTISLGFGDDNLVVELRKEKKYLITTYRFNPRKRTFDILTQKRFNDYKLAIKEKKFIQEEF